MRFKAGVKIEGAKPELILGLMVADRVYSIHGQELVITSCIEGVHKKGSLHYKGYAADLRTRYFTEATLQSVVFDLRTYLTDEFDIVLEFNHIHLEFDPK